VLAMLNEAALVYSCFTEPISTKTKLQSAISWSIMSSDLFKELTAPNGRKYTQPIGLFINNEWLKSSDGGTFASVNPT
jgi:hypothetical protein